jgi:hypothetical protein
MLCMIYTTIYTYNNKKQVKFILFMLDVLDVKVYTGTFYNIFILQPLQFVPTPIHPSPHQHPIFIHPHQLIQPQIITQFHQIPATPHRQVPHFPHFNGATRCFLTLAIVEITKRNRERSVIYTTVCQVPTSKPETSYNGFGRVSRHPVQRLLRGQPHQGATHVHHQQQRCTGRRP